MIVKLGPNDAANDKAQQTKQAPTIKQTAAKKSHADLLEACMMAQLHRIRKYSSLVKELMGRHEDIGPDNYGDPPKGRFFAK